MDVEKIRKDFDILKKGIIYFDNSATSLKPRQVLEKQNEFYNEYNANVHRGVHSLSVKASEEYEKAHRIVAKFINAKPQKVAFVKNATEALNMIANVVKKENQTSDAKHQQAVKAVTTDIEHHSNFVPYLQKKKQGIQLEFIKVSKEGEVNLDQVKDVCKKARLVSITHVSNVLGNIMPVNEIGKIARDAGALFAVDAAQSAPHMQIDVKKMDCDFLAIAGHKMLGPTGTGALYVKNPDALEPLMLGGGTIKEVNLENFSLAQSPDRFEAGTPNIAGAIGLGAAVTYLEKIGMSEIEKHEKALSRKMLAFFESEKKIDYYGSAELKNKTAVFAFNVAGVEPHDVASLLDHKKIMVRSGHHCAMPAMQKLGVAGTARASLYLYNTEAEVDKFISEMKQIINVFSK
jgi:cysteine desulfurase/selenocysteine lyase